MHFYCSFSYLIYTIYLTRDVIFVSLQYAFYLHRSMRINVVSLYTYVWVWRNFITTEFKISFKMTYWDSEPVFLKRNLINLQLFLFPYGFSSRQIYQNNAYRLMIISNTASVLNELIKTHIYDDPLLFARSTHSYQTKYFFIIDIISNQFLISKVMTMMVIMGKNGFP